MTVAGPVIRAAAAAIAVRVAVAAVMSAVAYGVVTPAFAKVKAPFLGGTLATEEGCKKLKAIAAGTPRRLDTVPDVLDQDGFKGWEGACEFTQVLEHEPGRVWVGLMVCSEGMTIAPQTYVFIRGDDGSFDVAANGQDAPELYRRCDTGEGKNRP